MEQHDDMHDSGFDAVLFDLDGVVTRTAELHATAWTELFDGFFEQRRRELGESHRPFDPATDYLALVDGKPRYEGVRSVLADRGIDLPEGDPTDDPGRASVHGLAARKDALFVERLREDGVQVFASTLALIRDLRAHGVKVGVVTSSRNGREVLRAAGLEGCFDARVDGLDAAALGLAGKPDPAPFFECARRLGAAPARSVVVEDAAPGVMAGRRGGFGLVVGVDRGGNREALVRNGADAVVADLGEVDVSQLAERLGAKRESVLAWRVEQEGFDPAREHEVESLFTLANGYLGVRGTLEAPLPGSRADLFVAGLYDRKHPDLPYSETEFLTEERGDYPYSELVPAPFPFRLALTVDGEPLGLVGSHARELRRVLDLRRGVLSAQIRYETGTDVRTRVRTWRCASLDDLHLLLQEVAIHLENHSGTVELDTALAVPDLEARHPHLVPLPADDVPPGLDVRRFRTTASGLELCLVSRATLVGGGRNDVRWRVAATIGQTLTFRRTVSVFTSRDGAAPLEAALDHALAQSWDRFDDALAAHVARWKDLWERADISVPGRPATEQALRFHAYHLSSAADHDPRVSVGARALSGRAYEGHVFWDAEIFMLPFHIHTRPGVARTMLRYRHHTLDGARRRARSMGCRGACYAWESTVTGADVTPRTIRLATTGAEIPIFTGTQQIHVTAGVAHGIWRYWEATRDEAFLRDHGVEMLIETARFWTSRASREGPRLHIRGVVGPDEYHHSVDDNAYTNHMARFNLERAVDAVAWMEARSPEAWEALAGRLGVSADEPHEWTEAARDLHVPGPNAEGVIEQFEGFFDLEEYPLPSRERFKAPVSRLFDWKRINELQLLKQADVLMLFYLFPDAFPREAVAASYRYYEPRTDHGSSLSPGVHAAVAARLGLREDAERYWRESLFLDLSNRMGNSTLGVHPACMGATWQALVFGFLGVHFSDDGPAVAQDAAARLPERWREVALQLLWRGRSYPLSVERRKPR